MTSRALSSQVGTKQLDAMKGQEGTKDLGGCRVVREAPASQKGMKWPRGRRAVGWRQAGRTPIVGAEWRGVLFCRHF